MSEELEAYYAATIKPVGEQRVNERIRTLAVPRPLPAPVGEKAVREQVMELLGLTSLPGAIADPETAARLSESTTTDDGLTITDVTFTNLLGEEVPGALVLPRDAHAGFDGSLPGVVCLPGSAGTHQMLIDPVVHRPNPTHGPLYGWARELARRGFATLSITLRGTNSRRRQLSEWEREARCMQARGINQMAYQVHESLQAARLLASMSQVDASRIGITGFSLGGNAAWWSASVEPWLAVAAPLCGGVGSVETLIREGDLDRHSSYWFVPNLLRYFDHPHIVASCICPRPLLVYGPLRDADMPATGVEAMEKVVRPAYQAAGAADYLEIHRPDLPHLMYEDQVDLLSAFFHRLL